VREIGPPAGATPGDPSGCEVERLFGAAGGSRIVEIVFAGQTHFRSGNTDGTPLSSGETEDRSLVETSRESGVPARERSTRALGKALERRTVVLPEDGGEKRRKEGVGKPAPRCAGNTLERRKSPREHRPHPLRRRRVRILAGSNALELWGIVAFWFLEQENAMPETARGHRRRKACGSARGKSSAG